MKQLIAILLILAIGLLSCTNKMSCTNKRPLEQENEAKPNFVFILIDDLGWADLPVYGNKFNEAPNIENLAEQGMTFTNAYAACAVCSPTRASIQSGQYPATVGITDFITGHWRPYEEVIVPKNRKQYLPNEIITFAERLKDAGYTNGYFGKWHLGNEGKMPIDQGYDEQGVTSGKFFGYNINVVPEREYDNKKVLANTLTDLSVDFIERQKDKPFLLFLSHFDVHVQLDAQEGLINKYLQKEKADGYPCNAVYAAMIENVDNSVGRVMKKLDELALSKNTIVIFFSDNGGLVSRFDKIPLIADSKHEIYEKDSLLYIASSNAPLRGEKGNLYEGGIREPMIVMWPGKIKAGIKNTSVISSVDFYPTFMDLAGISVDRKQKMDGESLKDVWLKNEILYDRPIFWHYPVYHHGVPSSAIRKGDYKLIENLVDHSLELYDLNSDIGETKNLVISMPDKAEELFNELQSWQKSVVAQFPIPNPDFDQDRRYEWGTHPDRK